MTHRAGPASHPETEIATPIRHQSILGRTVKMLTLGSRFIRTTFVGLAIMLFIGLTAHGQAFAATESVLHSFTGAPGDGYTPHDLVKNLSGILYGTSTGGGSNNRGTVFALTTSGSGCSESIIWDFGSGTDGIQPQS